MDLTVQTLSTKDGCKTSLVPFLILGVSHQLSVCGKGLKY